ncbi:hypothetical protein TIFTF001_048964 [Ficus carica]|uniref:Uncharacterized protein n=1 Tax=Ficus carica TaxID=3494 RepID=A0AA87YYK2_FICCA|nr:hypothetical protein TIFTF001_048964 [Ficus carica]
MPPTLPSSPRSHFHRQISPLPSLCDSGIVAGDADCERHGKSVTAVPPDEASRSGNRNSFGAPRSSTAKS